MNIRGVSPVMLVGLAASAGAAPYAWVPGSTADASHKTGDRVAVVDLADGDVITSHITDGWQYTTESAGADPFNPAFSPDGKFIYLVNGGDGNVDAPNAHIYLFDTQEIIDILEADGTPNTNLVIQKTTIVSDDEDAIEPIGLTISPDFTRAYFVDSKDEKVWSYSINSTTGELTALGSPIPTGPYPSSFWISPGGNLGFFCSTTKDTRASRLEVVTLFPTPTKSKTFNFTIPAGSGLFGSLAVPYTYCALRYDVATRADSVTVVPIPEEPIVSPTLEVFAGNTGILTNFGPIAGPCDIYHLDLTGDSSTTVKILEQESGGPTAFRITPSGSQVVFPPILQSFDNGAGGGPLSLIGGSTVLDLDSPLATPTSDRLVPPDATLFATVGQMSRDRNSFFIGSAATSNINIGSPSLNYTPSRTDSKVYRYDFSAKANVTLTSVHTVARPITFVVGQTDTRIVAAGATTFFINNQIPGGATPATAVLVLLDPAGVEAPITADTLIVAGAYGQQPLPGAAPATPEADVFVGASAVLDSTGSVSLGSFAQSTTSTNVTITVENNGTADLTTSNLTVPVGVTIVNGLQATITAGNSDDIILKLDTSAVRTVNGTVAFDNNDDDEDPYNFTVTGSVTAALPTYTDGWGVK